MTRRDGHRAHPRWLVPLVLVALTVGCSTSVDGRGSIGVTTAADASAAAPSDSAVAPSGGADPSAADTHERWLPSETNPDPTVDIEGVYIGAPALYAQRYHFSAPDRVAYDRYPPVGGPHDPTWAACDGVVYDKPVRDEMMVHALEHGAVWIAYDPDILSAADLADLSTLVPQIGYLVMTPYPGLGTPLSLQAWGHQLALPSGSDPRFQQFLLAMLRNPYLTPEPNASCNNPTFDLTDPPPFVAERPGPDAVPLDFVPPADPTVTTTTG